MLGRSVAESLQFDTRKKRGDKEEGDTEEEKMKLLKEDSEDLAPTLDTYQKDILEGNITVNGMQDKERKWKRKGIRKNRVERKMTRKR